MIKSKTVLILGAGASRPFGYPLGNQLHQKIIEKLGNGQFREKIMYELGLSPAINERFINEFWEDLLKSKPSSIDQYLSTLDERYRLIGKATIASIMLDCEIEKNLYESDENWYVELYKILRRDSDVSNFGDNNLSIITFNYDRSWEQFLYSRLEGDFGDQSKDLIKKHIEDNKIIHVHGRLPYLSWESSKRGIDYGFDKEAFNVSSIAEGLKIMGEDTSMLMEAQSLIKDAANVYFLGFGYHQSNLDKLNLSTIKKCQRIKGTCYKESMHNQSSIKVYFDNRIGLSDIECQIYPFILKHFNPDEHVGLRLEPVKYR